MDTFANWYNHEHRHTDRAPHTRRRALRVATDKAADRRAVLTKPPDTAPLQHRRHTEDPRLPNTVWINRPAQDPPRRPTRQPPNTTGLIHLEKFRHGNVLDILVQSRRNAKAAKRFSVTAQGLRYVPRVIVTDKLPATGRSPRAFAVGDHRRSKYLNNRAENSHQPTSIRERVMKRFASPGRLNGSCLLSATSGSTFVPAVI